MWPGSHIFFLPGKNHKGCLITSAQQCQHSLGAQRQKVTFLLEQGLMTKYGWGGYETQEKPRLSTGGRGVQT